MRFRSLVGGLWIRITAAALQVASNSSRQRTAAKRLRRTGCSVSSMMDSLWKRACRSAGIAGGKVSSTSEKDSEAFCAWRTRRGVESRETGEDWRSGGSVGRLWTEVAGEETLDREANRVRLGAAETRGERDGGGTETGTVARLRMEGEGEGEADGENVFERWAELVEEKKAVDGRLERLWTEEGDAASERTEARL